MSLIDAFYSECVIMDKVRTADGEGGFITEWTEGPEIQAAITLDTTLEARIAEQSGVKSVYTVTTNSNVVLEYHDVLKRLSDGVTFRVTSNGSDKTAPAVSSIQISQVTAERWDLA